MKANRELEQFIYRHRSPEQVAQAEALGQRVAAGRPTLPPWQVVGLLILFVILAACTLAVLAALALP